MKKHWGIIAALAGLLLCGCVEREMTITSSPPGALVYVSDVEVGRTPVTIPFTWYGDYDIVLRREGYQTLTTHANINPPAYEIPPFDLLSDMAPWTYKDQRYLNFSLQKYVGPTTQQAIQDADALRALNRQTVTP